MEDILFEPVQIIFFRSTPDSFPTHHRATQPYTEMHAYKIILQINIWNVWCEIVFYYYFLLK